MSMTPAAVLQVLEKPNTGLVNFVAKESTPIPELIGTPNGFPRWCAVNIDTDGTAIYPTGGSGRIIGVSLQSVLTGEVLPVLLLNNGIALVTVGSGGVTQGESVGSDSSGHAVSGAGLGVALQAGSSGDVVAVLLVPGVVGASGAAGACGVSGVSGTSGGACGVSGVPGACGVSGVSGVAGAL